ncbi:hypothetical protein [Streptomyces tubercidicus]
MQMIRTMLGPATPPNSRRALFALVNDALPLYRQQAKNLLGAPQALTSGTD